MRRLTAATSLLAALAATLATATPAAADAVSFRDERGDAVARYDLTRVKVTNGGDRLVVNAGVLDLRGDRTQIFGFSITPVNGDATYMLQTVRRANGRTTARLGGYSSDGTPLEVACKVTRTWRPAQDSIKVAFTRDCLREQGPVRVHLYIGAGNGTSGDPVDWTKTVRVGQG